MNKVETPVMEFVDVIAPMYSIFMALFIIDCPAHHGDESLDVLDLTYLI